MIFKYVNKQGEKVTVRNLVGVTSYPEYFKLTHHSEGTDHVMLEEKVIRVDITSYRIIKTSLDVNCERSWVLRDKVKGIFSEAIHFHLTHDKILDLISSRLYSDKWWAKLPQYFRSEIHGYIYARFDAIYDHLVFLYKLPDGTLITGRDLAKKQAEGYDAVANKVQSAYLWEKDNKPYTDWSYYGA